MKPILLACLLLAILVLTAVGSLPTAEAQAARLQAGQRDRLEVQPDLTCSPKPCRLPNVRVSKGPRTNATARPIWPSTPIIRCT